MICFILLLAIITACEPLHNGSAVIIVKTWTDIERGLPISLVTETDLLTRPKQDEMILHAKIPSVFCTRVQLKNTRKTDLTINHMDITKTIPVQDGALTVNLTKEDISEKGKYVLELRTYTTYTLHSIYKPLRLIKCLHNIQDTPVFTTEVNRHIHLYVFDAPVLRWGENNRTLVCQLSTTGGFRDILVSFTREYKKETYQRKPQWGIVSILPDTITQQDTGNYSCSLRVTDPESDDKGIMIDGTGHEMVTAQPPSPEPPVSKINYALLLEIFIPIQLAIVIGILAVGGMIIYRAVKKRGRGIGNLSHPNSRSTSPNDRTPLVLSLTASYNSSEHTILFDENQSQAPSPRPDLEISTDNEDLQQPNDPSVSLSQHHSVDTTPSSSSRTEGNVSPDPVSSKDNSSSASQAQPPVAGSPQPHSIDSAGSRSSDVDSSSSSQSQSVDDKGSPKVASVGSVSLPKHSVDTAPSRSTSSCSSSSTDDDSSSKQKQASVSAAGSLQPHSIDSAGSRSSDIDSSSSSQLQSVDDKSSPKAASTGSISLPKHSVDTAPSRSSSAGSSSSSTDDDDSSSKQKQASVSVAGSLQQHSMDAAVSRSSSDVDSPLACSSSSTASSSADGTRPSLSTGTSVKNSKHGTTESKYEKEGNQERKKKKSSRKKGEK